MRTYKFMNRNGIKAMRVNALLWVTVITIALLIFTLLNIFKLHWLNNRSIIIAIGVIIVVLVVILIIVVPIFRYKNFRYSIDEDEVRIRKGIIFINTNVIPYFRIQNIDINEGFIMRKYKLASLTLSTAGGNSDIELVDKEEAERLKLLIKQNKTREKRDHLSSNDFTDENYFMNNYEENE